MAQDELIGKTIVGKYLVEDHLGSGGMGTVYRARQVDIGHLVALKVLRAELSADWAQLERFKREAKAAASLSHPNVAQITDLHLEAGQRAVMVMELVDGASLEQLIVPGERFAPRRAALLLRQLLSALAAAHDAGIMHRDVKPANIMVVEVTGVGEVVKLLDFGIAKLLDGDVATKLTATGVTLGTPMYMPPEQILGRQIDHRVDLYATGVILYEALAGQMPYEFEGLRDFFAKLTTEGPRSLREVAPDLPRAIVEVVDRSIAPSPDDRYQTAREMSEALESWSTTKSTPSALPVAEPNPVSLTLATTTTTTARRKPPMRVILAGAALVGAALCVFGVFLGMAIVARYHDSETTIPEPELDLAQPTRPTISPTPPPMPAQPPTPLTQAPPIAEAPPRQGEWNKMPYPFIPLELMPETRPKRTTPHKCQREVEIMTSEHIEVTNGAALSISGNQKIYLDRCVIKGEVGILIEDRAQVTANNCWIEGEKSGALIYGHGKLTVSGGVLKGAGGPMFGGHSAALLFGPSQLIVQDAKVLGFVKKMGNGSVFGLDR